MILKLFPKELLTHLEAIKEGVILSKGLVRWKPAAVDKVKLTVLHSGLNILFGRLIKLIIPLLEELEIAKSEGPVPVSYQLLFHGTENVTYISDEIRWDTLLVHIVCGDLAELLLKLLVRREVICMRMRNNV